MLDKDGARRTFSMRADVNNSKGIFKRCLRINRNEERIVSRILWRAQLDPVRRPGKT